MMEPMSALRNLLERTLSGQSTDADRAALYRACLTGQISAVASDRGVSVGGSVINSTIVTGDGNVVLQGTGSDVVVDAFRSILRRIEDDRHDRALRDYFRALRGYAEHLPYLVLDDQLPGRHARSLDTIYVPLRFVRVQEGAAADASQPADELSIADVLS